MTAAASATGTTFALGAAPRPGGQQILGVGVSTINSQHLPRQSRRAYPITSVNRRHRPISRSSMDASRSTGLTRLLPK